MTIHNFLLKSTSVAIALAGGLAIAAQPAAAEMEESGDFGAAEPEATSIEAYGDNTGEVILPEENDTPAFQSEGGDFGAAEPEGTSIEAYGDNAGEVIIPDREGTRDASDTDDETERNSDFGADEPEEAADIDNFGENTSVN